MSHWPAYGIFAFAEGFNTNAKANMLRGWDMSFQTRSGVWESCTVWQSRASVSYCNGSQSELEQCGSDVFHHCVHVRTSKKASRRDPWHLDVQCPWSP
eukprot:1155566-Pelagomonas_calceolata.AAC.3